VQKGKIAQVLIMSGHLSHFFSEMAFFCPIKNQKRGHVHEFPGQETGVMKLDAVTELYAVLSHG
jgi:hypothetical protein